MAEVFAAVANEVVQILGVDAVSLDRDEPDRTTTVVAAVNAPAFAVGTRWPLDDPSLSIQVFETGRPARIDDYSGLPGTVAAAARDSGVRSALGVPIIADGAIWGMAWAGTASIDPLPAATEERLRDFAELVAIAISNADSRDRLRRLADQQASLRRVATLVAEGATPTELFSAVAEEVARILDVTSVSVGRYEPDGELAVVASVNDAGFPVGSRWPVEGAGLFMTVLETGRPARIDDYSDLPGAVAAAARASGAQSGVGAPIVVDGRVWGLIAVGRRQRRDALPGFTGSYTGRIVLSAESGQDTEARLSAFTELVATAISRAQAHDDLRSLAEEQAALRRVATLVAEAAAPVDIFAAVVDEIAHLLELPRIEMVRYETDGTATRDRCLGRPSVRRRDEVGPRRPEHHGLRARDRPVRSDRRLQLPSRPDRRGRAFGWISVGDRCADHRGRSHLGGRRRDLDPVGADSRANGRAPQPVHRARRDCGVERDGAHRAHRISLHAS